MVDTRGKKPPRNRKLTDFFGRPPPSSSQVTPPSSPPRSGRVSSLGDADKAHQNNESAQGSRSSGRMAPTAMPSTPQRGDPAVGALDASTAISMGTADFLSPTSSAMRRSTRVSVPPVPFTSSSSPVTSRATPGRAPKKAPEIQSSSSVKDKAKDFSSEPISRPRKHLLSPQPSRRGVPQTSAQKRRRLPSGVTDEEIVPTSNTEELELIRPLAIRTNISGAHDSKPGTGSSPPPTSSDWDGVPLPHDTDLTSTASSPLPALTSDEEDVDMVVGDPEADNTQASILEVENQLDRTQLPGTPVNTQAWGIVADEPAPGSSRAHTPPPSAPTDLASPVVLDAKSKTAQMIAEIKAKAYASIQPSSDEDPAPLVLPDDLDAESDLEDDSALFAAFAPKKDKGKAKRYYPSDQSRHVLILARL
jgi:hypothetical protein